MRIQCPLCNELAEVTRFTTTTDPPRLAFRCPACGEQVTQVASGGPTPALGVAVVSGRGEEGEAGKDGGGAKGAKEAEGAAGAKGEEAATRAGEGKGGQEVGSAAAPQAAATAKAEEKARPGARPAREGKDALWNAWDHVTARYEDEARHDAFLVACEASEALPFAAARYREWAASHPEDPIAPARQKRIMALAQVKALLKAGRGEKEKDPVKQAVLLGLVLVVLLAVVVITAPLVFQGVAGPPRGGAEGRRVKDGAEPQLQNLARPRPRPPRRTGPAPGPDAGPRPASARDGSVPSARDCATGSGCDGSRPPLPPGGASPDRDGGAADPARIAPRPTPGRPGGARPQGGARPPADARPRR